MTQEKERYVLLTTKEYELLYRLALYEGRVLSYRQLYEAVWGEDPMGNEANAVSCHVYGLRRKFREIALSLPSAIRCVREVGFCFEDITE